MNIQSVIPNEKGFGSIGNIDYKWGRLFSSTIDASRLSTSTSLELNSYINSNPRNTALSLYQVTNLPYNSVYISKNSSDGNLYVTSKLIDNSSSSPQLINTGDKDAKIDYINTNLVLGYQAIEGLQDFNSTEYYNKKHLTVYNGSLVWRYLVDWEDVGGPKILRNSINKILKVSDTTQLLWSRQFDIKRLNTFTDMELDDLVAVYDESTSFLKKSTIRHLIKSYYVETAKEISILNNTVRDSFGNIVSNPLSELSSIGSNLGGAWESHSAQDLTSESLTSLFEDGSRIGTSQICKDATFTEVPCFSKNTVYRTQILSRRPHEPKFHSFEHVIVEQSDDYTDPIDISFDLTGILPTYAKILFFEVYLNNGTATYYKNSPLKGVESWEPVTVNSSQVHSWENNFQFNNLSTSPEISANRGRIVISSSKTIVDFATEPYFGPQTAEGYQLLRDKESADVCLQIIKSEIESGNISAQEGGAAAVKMILSSYCPYNSVSQVGYGAGYKLIGYIA